MTHFTRRSLRYELSAFRAIYCTSFCNFGHDVLTGKPVAHECFILHPEDLRAEIKGTDAEVSALAARGMRKRTVDGAWRRNPGDWGNSRAISLRGREGRADVSLADARTEGSILDTGTRFVRARVSL